MPDSSDSSDSSDNNDHVGLAQLGSEFIALSDALAVTNRGLPNPERVITFAAKAVPHSAHCSLTLIRPNGRPSTVAATGDVPIRVDEIQYESREGPCLEAATGDDICHVENFADEARWPTFSRRCVAETDIRSAFAVRLTLPDDNRATINFFGIDVSTFTELDHGVGAIFAPFASLALQGYLHEERATALDVALQSSRQIGMAVGILMAQQLVTSDAAFALLTKASQHLNIKLRDIAAEVTRTGQLPGVPPARTPSD